MSSQVRETEAEEGTAGRFVRATIAAMAGYQPGEQPRDARIVKLNTNENPYPPSPAVAAAVAEASEKLWLYPEPTARPVREALATLLSVPADGIVVGNGSDELLSLLMRAVVEPGEIVAYPVPTYSLYDSLVAIQGGVARHFPFPADFSLPAEILDIDARMRILCNPNSPSGTALPLAELVRVAQARPDAILVVDEAYVDFADESAVSMVGRFSNVVVLRTLSKSYSLAGLRVGFALTTPALARELHKVRDSYNVGRLAQAGALAALADQAWMLANLARIRRTRAWFSRALEELGYRVPPSQGNFVLAQRPGRSLAEVATKLRQAGVIVRHFAELPDALRISIGTDEQMELLLERLRALS